MIYSILYSIYATIYSVAESLESTELAGLNLSAAGYILFAAVALFFSLAVEICGFVFRAAGTYTLAKRRGLKSPWRAWIPFVSLLVFGELSQYPDKKAWGTTAAVFAVVTAGLKWAFLIVIDIIFAYKPLNTLFSGQPLTSSSVGISFFTVDGKALGNGFYELFANLSKFSALAHLGLLTSLFIPFIRAYKPEKASVYWVAALVVGLLFESNILFGIFAFAARKDEPKDYSRFMTENARRYYGGYGGYNAYRGNGYTQRNDGENAGGREEPFGEFGDDKEPFDELGGKETADGEKDEE